MLKEKIQKNIRKVGSYFKDFRLPAEASAQAGLSTFDKPRLWRGGFTLIEVIVVIAILGILATITTLSFNNFRGKDSLEANASSVLSMYEKARENTVSSLENSKYGVYATTTKFVIFKGDVYSEGANGNDEFLLEGGVVLQSIDLIGGGQSVVFERLTGKTSEYGLITIGLSSDPTKKIDIIIENTGLIHRN